MPELPEVETVMRGLSPVLLNQVIEVVQVRRKDLRVPFPRGLKKTLEGQKITALSRRAKYILITLGGGDILVIHLGMSGSMRIIPPNEAFAGYQKHDHFAFTLKGGAHIIYNDPRRFGMIFMAQAGQLETHKAFAHLGPEPLGNAFSGEVLAARLKGKKTSIKQALLDQRLVVGVGNIYACEALYQSGISPLVEAGHIKGARAENLVVQIRDVLTRAIAAGGSTLKDHRQADGELGYFQHNFAVYDREKQPCAGCDCDIVKTGGVQRIVQSGRSTFYCAQKQKKR